jgi:hypothetical protein
MMAYQGLYVLLEGPDDERFFEHILKPIFKQRYDWAKPYRFVQKSPKLVKAFLHSIKRLQCDYFFLTDINHFSCVTAKKSDILNKYDSVIDPAKVIIVIKEIESWYLAGLNDKTSKIIGIQFYATTDHITKEMFNDIVPQAYGSRDAFMMEVLKSFSTEVAARKNDSFAYFLKRIER